MSIEAMKQALEALEKMVTPRNFQTHQFCQKAYDDLRQAIAEAEKQEQGEPVGKFAKFTDGIWREVADGSAGVPLYTTPQQRTWVGLTDDEMLMIYGQQHEGKKYSLGRMVQQALKEKNT